MEKMDKMEKACYLLVFWVSFGLMISLFLRSLFVWPQDPFSALWLSLAIGGAGFTIAIIMPAVARFITRENLPFVYGWFSAVITGVVFFLLAGLTDSIIVESARLTVLALVGSGMTHLLYNRDLGLGGAR